MFAAKSRSLRVATAVWLLVVSALACARTTAPTGWLPSVREAPGRAYGGWVTVSWVSGPQRREVRGELIAIGLDTLFLMGDAGLAAIPIAGVDRVTLTAYDPENEVIALWGGLGAVATLSHGWWLVISAPVWIIATAVGAAGESRSPQLIYPKVGLQDLGQYARFPQGPPQGVDLKALTPKGSR